MRATRRGMIPGAGAVLAAPAFSRGARSGWYDRAIVIDALGTTYDPFSDDGVLRLSDRAWSETLATGVTIVRDTVSPVGNVADPWGDYLNDIDAKKDMFAANPDRLLLAYRFRARRSKWTENGHWGLRRKLLVVGAKVMVKEQQERWPNHSLCLRVETGVAAEKLACGSLELSSRIPAIPQYLMTGWMYFKNGCQGLIALCQILTQAFSGKSGRP